MASERIPGQIPPPGQRFVIAALAVVGLLIAAALYAVFRSTTPTSPMPDGPDGRVAPATAPARPGTSYAGKRILEIDSYHESFPWTAQITAGVRQVLAGTEAELQVFRMDTKRKSSKEEIAAAALAAKKQIEAWRPDVVIVSDDNAVKYLLVPYYKNTGLPFVFCGVNWEADSYGLPFANTTGMIEVALMDEVENLLRPHAGGDRLGILISDTFTEHKDVAYFQKICGLEFHRTVYVRTWAEWKQRYVELQDEVDMLICGTVHGIPDFDRDAAPAFALEHARVPSGTYNRSAMPFTMMGIVRVPEELGEWSARTALRILDGTPPSEIPLTRNRRGQLLLNLPLADKLGVVFPESVLENAEILE